MVSLKKLRTIPLFFVLVCFFSITACNDENKDEMEKIAKLSFDENSLPDMLAADGGTVTIGVNWAYTEWEVTQEVIAGNEFITDISPLAGGDSEVGNGTTMLEITFGANNQSAENQQKIIINSITHDLSDEIVLTQSGKVIPTILVSVNPDIVHQTISGFGGANMIWGTDYLNSDEMDMAFGTGEDQLGLSIYRVRLSSNKNDWAGLVNSIKMANDRNAKVLASPWSPPAEWNSNNSINGGGYLLEEHYADFANYINEFIQFMADNGATVDVVSVQNEPDWKASYEGCEYTVEQMFNFVKNHAGNIEGAEVLAAESLNTNHAYTDDILNDAIAVNNIDIVGGHLYGGGLAPYPLVHEKSKELWMTEHLMNLDSGNHPENWTEDTDEEVIWDETMDMLEEIHATMVLDWNAYIWWYIRRYYSFLGDGEKGTERGTILKRGYAFSHYSRFVRPGYQRVDVSSEDDSVLKITAYKGDGNIVIVAINSSEYFSKTIEVSVPADVSSAVAYTTSVDHDRQKFDDIITEDKIIVELPRESITTVVLK